MWCFLLFVLGVAVVYFARYPVERFKGWLLIESDLGDRPVGVPPWITGVFERALAFILFFLGLNYALLVLIAWVTAKLSANWQRRQWPDDKEEARELRARTFIALMTGVLSLAIGAGAGAIAHCACS